MPRNLINDAVPILNVMRIKGEKAAKALKKKIRTASRNVNGVEREGFEKDGFFCYKDNEKNEMYSLSPTGRKYPLRALGWVYIFQKAEKK